MACSDTSTPSAGTPRSASATAIAAAMAASNRLTALLRSSEIADDEGFFALGAVTVGMHRSLQTLEAHVRFPAPA